VRTVFVAAAVGPVLCVISLAAVERAKPQTHTVTIEGMRFHPTMKAKLRVQ
jgi:hypothetical protein